MGLTHLGSYVKLSYNKWRNYIQYYNLAVNNSYKNLIIYKIYCQRVISLFPATI